MQIKENDLIEVTDDDINIDGTFIIPKNINGIGMYAFKNCSSLKNITIPKKVRTIGYQAFCNCKNLTFVNIEGAKWIADSSFNGCGNLVHIRLPNSIVAIGKKAFAHCQNLREINIPERVTTIEESTFDLCENLISINLSSNITIIDKGAFSNCINLENINIPNSVEVIGENAFSHCSSLKEINIPDNVKDIGPGAFENCTSLKTIIILSNKLTEIKKKTFRGCKSLNEITIPINVKTIYSGAFFCCESLKNVNISKNVTSIESIAFSNCTSLEHIILPEKLLYIGIGAFSNCKSLKEITIPNSVEISESAFSDCDSLKEIILPEIVLLGCRVFRNCISLEKMNLSNTYCKSIPDGLFSGCINLADIKLPNCIDTIGKKSFYNCRSLKTINIPNTIKSIGDSAFSGCVNLENIDLPSNLNKLCSFTFEDCISLKTINIPKTIQVIDIGAFCNCTNLEKVELTDKLKEIYSVAFVNCKKLNNLIISNKIKINFYHDIFKNCTSLKNITVLSGLSQDLIMQFKSLLRINLVLDTSLFFIDINHLKELSIESLMIYNIKINFYTIDIPVCIDIDGNLNYERKVCEKVKLEEQLREIREEELIDKINYALLDNYIFDAKCFKVSEHKKIINQIIKNLETFEYYDYKLDFEQYISEYVNLHKPKEMVEVKNIESMLVDINRYELNNKDLNNATDIEEYGNELLNYSFYITKILSKLQTSSKNNIETVNLNKILDKITKLESRNPDEISKLIKKVFFDISEDEFVLNKSLMNKLINYTRYKVGNLNDEIKGFETLKEIIRICIEKINICKDNLNQKEITDGEDFRLSNIDNNSIRNNISIKIDTLNNNEIMLDSLYEQINNLENLNQIYIDRLKEIIVDTLPSLLQNVKRNNVVLKSKEDIEILNNVCEILKELVKLGENNNHENTNLEMLDGGQEKTYKK